jgi:membrane-associated phospholipid phosphatase
MAWRAVGAVGLAWAQVVAQAAEVSEGQRLSDWLLEHHGAVPDTTALHWRVPAQRLAQADLQRAAQQAVRALPTPPEWSEWFMRLPLTGRLPVANGAPRALQIMPRDDPVLGRRDEVVLYPRPSHVAVLSPLGEPCLLPHASAATALDYVRSCWGTDASNAVDWVWWVAPDGESGRDGVAAWNEGAPTPLAPGAWLWAPPRNSGLQLAASDNIAKFLATQPPLEYMQPQPALKRVAQAPAVARAAPARDAAISSNAWGETGLIQTPTARMMATGSGRFHLSRVWPYTRGNLFVQPFDWLETGFRYTDIANRAYGAADFSGNQSYKDKSIDVRVRLHAEDAFWPQVTLGVRDIGGTGLFSSEYLVASKRWGAWDASLGLGWGNLGSHADLRNPLRALGRSDSRVADQGDFGGTTNSGAWFTGPAAVFGGVQYQASDQWLLKAEVDGNDYQHEPRGNALPTRSRINVGAVYRQTPYVDWSLSLERGQRIGLGVTLHSGPEGLSGLDSPKVFGPSLPPWGEAGSLAQMDLAQAIQAATGWRLLRQRRSHGEAMLLLEVDSGPYLQDQLEAVVRLAHLRLPEDDRRLVVQLQRRGLGLQRIEVDRAEWVAQRTQATVPALRLSDATATAPQASAGNATPLGTTADEAPTPVGGLRWSVGPNYHQVLGGPNGFVLYQLGLRANAEWGFNANTWLAGRAELRAIDNYSGFVADAPDTGLPKVRSDLRRYLTTSRTTLPLLQATRVDDWGGGWFSSAYAGYFEPMYGGVGGEIYHQAWGSSWAWGLDLNHAVQREFDQGLRFRDYRVNTGHLSAYWDTGVSGIEAKLSVGRYLAGDWGATLDLSRRFANGVAMGFWATKTDVSAEQFGEGSFDKGFYVTLPFDALMPTRTPGVARLVWNPLTRDGGARLNRRYPLRELLQGRSASDWAVRAATPPPRHSGDTLTAVTPPAPASLLQRGGQGLRVTALGISRLPASTWAWALGAVALSSRWDDSGQRWASRRSGKLWSATEALGQAVPYALAAGASALWLADAPEHWRQTAGTALVAGASAYAINQGLRFVVGRARPEAGQGSGLFDGWRGRAFQSSFASNHTALAFALATPFAQNYDAPWLYGAAALTGLSRLQSGAHWLSDVVAGGLMGYGVASLINADQARRDAGWHWRVGLQRVEARYTY